MYKIFFSVVIIGFLEIIANARPAIIFNQEEKEILKYYLDYEKDDNNIEYPKIVTYISNTINYNTDFNRWNAAFFLMDQLADQHRRMLETTCKNFIISSLTNGSLSKIDNKKLSVIKKSLVSLGKIRNESTIIFLEKLVFTHDEWTNPSSENLKLADDQSELDKLSVYRTIRYGAFEGIFDIHDSISETLLNSLEKKIKESREDTINRFLLNRIELYRKIYRGEIKIEIQ
jgi:hypothetical protein